MNYDRDIADYLSQLVELNTTTNKRLAEIQETLDQILQHMPEDDSGRIYDVLTDIESSLSSVKR